MSKTLFAVNPNADLRSAQAQFSSKGRTQVRDFLVPEAAEEIRRLLRDGTPWGLSIQAGDADQPEQVRAEELQQEAVRQKIGDRVRDAHRAASEGRFSFVHARYSLVDAYLGQWRPGGPHDILLEYLNAPDFLDPLRTLTGIPEIRKADAHASLFAPGHFLTSHLDEHSGEGRRVAYVLNFAPDEWFTDWGGYLVFFDADGDIVEGFRPRFNSLNLFRVPQAHSVTFVPPFAPATRLAISGWLLDR
ncbi:2OG-Fe(II) oxygenase [Tsuneonella sp. YG55]|uniref:2OG-Fe(II) oxygenase n=1 Tax=Tsuneonella litorea TaxID=2976475 RepID=A0A9X2W2Q5_9SPHN|nr:2OG-Fe(II) oxygenase family protein [Tsuneonella litorea]MCT2559672.1 2OG-Fe(II) oxygenase [Tsuneonella litorea]